MENQEDKIKLGSQEKLDNNSKQGHASQENQITKDLKEEPKDRVQQSDQAQQAHEKKQDQREQEEDGENDTPLFRAEAMEAKKGNYFGKTLIITPVSFSIWTFGIFAIALVIGLYLYFGEYSKRQNVEGILVPDKGIMTIYAKNSGVITKKFVNQGDKVIQGQLLYLISTEQESLGGPGVAAQQVELLEKQIEVQKNKIAMFEKNAAGYDDLLSKHYISQNDYQRRQEDYFSAKLALHDFEKQLSQTKSGAEYAIRAPGDGTISTLISSVGDRVTAETVLGVIIPKDSFLQARLFVPTSKAGFIKVGQKVLLKYRPYSYQRFGLYEGTVSLIDKSIINLQENKAFPIPVKMDEAVFYRVTVTLKQQTVNVYGQPYPLTPGMLLEGIILGEKRNIWQWVMEPIYSLRGNI